MPMAAFWSATAAPPMPRALYTQSLRPMRRLRRSSTPGSARIAQRRQAGSAGRQTPQDGAAEALFGIAASLTDETSADIAILYLRLALYLRPDLDLARHPARRPVRDAAEIRRRDRGLSQDRPRLALLPRWRAVQIAIDEARLDKNDEAIARSEGVDGVRSERRRGLDGARRCLSRREQVRRSGRRLRSRAIALSARRDEGLAAVFCARDRRGAVATTGTPPKPICRQALKLSPERAAGAELSRLQLGRSGPQHPRSAGDAGEGAHAEPYDGYIVDSVGWAYYRLGRYDDAAKTLEEAVLLVPGDPTINDHLGDALLAGRPQAGCAVSSGTMRWPSVPTPTRSRRSRRSCRRPGA